MKFYDVLDRLANPTNDLGGGPGASDAKAFAQLIMQGGKASLGGQTLFGQNDDGTPFTGNGGAPADPGVIDPNTGRFPRGASRMSNEEAGFGVAGNTPPTPAERAAKLPNNLQAVLASADTIANNLTSGTKPEKKTLIANPYGPGSYDPDNADERKQVLEQGKVQKGIDEARRQLSSQFVQSLPKEQQGEVIKAILEKIGVTKSAEQKEFDKAKGHAAGEIAGGKQTGVERDLDKVLSVEDATKLGVPYGTTKREAAAKDLYGLTHQQLNTVNEMGKARTIVDQLEVVANRLKDKYSPEEGGLLGINRATAGAALKKAELEQSDPDIALYNDLKKSLLAGISRTVGSERGTSTEKDVARAEGSLPDFSGLIDTKTQVKERFSGLHDVINGMENVASQGFKHREKAPGGATGAPSTALGRVREKFIGK